MIVSLVNVIPLLRRMYDLKKLILQLEFKKLARFIDGMQLHQDILMHLPRLETFIFHIYAKIHTEYPLPSCSPEDMRRAFNTIVYEEMTVSY